MSCGRNGPALPVNDADWLRAGPVVLVNGRWLPPLPRQTFDVSAPCLGMAEGAIAFARIEPHDLPADPIPGLDDAFDNWYVNLPHVNAGGRFIRYPWELVAHNAQRLCDEFDCQRPPRLGPWPQTGWRPAASHLVGPQDRLLIDSSARIDPLTAFDTTAGPVTVAAGAVVQAFSRLEGPCYIGPGTHVLGANVRGGTTLGPCCRVGGEIEASIIQGYSNKYHGGFLGHSYVGSWVNFGAGSQCSDLRHDYGEVTVMAGGRAMPTGMNKVGCFVGDHTKIGLGCLLNSGTHVGAFGHLLPSGRLLPRHIPPFCGTRFDRLTECKDLDAAALETASRVMARRGRELTAADEAAIPPTVR